MHWYHDLRSAQRLTLGFASVILLLMINVASALVMANGGRDMASRIANVRMPTALASTGLYANLEGSLAAMRGFLLTGNSALRAGRAEAWGEIDRLRAEMDRLSGSWTVEANRQAWTEAKPLLNELRKA